MTCFWDGLISALGEERIKNVLNYKITKKKKNNVKKFIQALKKKNIKTVNVLWNDEKISSKLLGENMVAINSLNIEAIGHGYLCSCCEPFLFLIAQLFDVNIKHEYFKTTIKYTNVKAHKSSVIKFKSDDKHFWCL